MVSLFPVKTDPIPAVRDNVDRYDPSLEPEKPQFRRVLQDHLLRHWKAAVRIVGGFRVNEPLKLRQMGIGLKLREFREKSGMTTRSVATALGISASSVNRTELGQRNPGRDEVNALCALYGVIGDQKLALLERAAGLTDNTAWLELASRIPGPLTSLTLLEREASKITYVENAVIPGLVQTADYARLVMGMTEVDDQALDDRVGARLARQALLSRRRPPTVRLFVDEAALRRTLGDARVMWEQLQHLLVIQRREDVTLRVVPMCAEANPMLDGAFTLYDLPDGSRYVFVESRAFGVFLSEAADVAPFVEAASVMDHCALDEESSCAVTKRIAEGLLDE